MAQNAQLKALYSNRDNNAPIGGMQPPPTSVAMARDGTGPTALPPDVEPTDILDMVTKAERHLHQLGLRKVGIPETTLKRIRALQGLASSSGHFIAQSLEVTSRSYYVQILELMELAKALHKRLMAKPGEPEYIQDDEARAMFNKNYVEMVKEAGRAFELMLTAATAMVKMIADTNGTELPGGKKKKQGWAIVNVTKTPKPEKPSLPPMPD